MVPSLKNQFFLDPKITYLNHGSFGACAKPIYKDLLKWQSILESQPVKFFEETVFNELAKSRNALGHYINCNADDLVYFPNPTTAINAVARSLNLNEQDEVLSTNHIYGALDRSWKYLCDKKKAVFVKAQLPFPIYSKQEFLDVFLNYVNSKTKIIFLDHITSMTAMIFPIKEVIDFAKKKNIITIIDGAHVPGHIDLDIKDLNPDIYTGACHKWMCTPKGVSFLYVKKELQELIHPIVISWGWESESPGHSQFLDWHDWQGTRDMSAFLTIPEAIRFLEQNNWTEVAKKCRQQVISTRNDFLNLLDISPPCPDNWLAQMSSIPIEIDNIESCKNLLLKKYKIEVPIFNWEGKIFLRYSIQAYNSSNDLDKLLSAIKELIL